MKRRLAALLAVLQLLACAVSASAAEWDPTDPNDPLLWEPDLPEFDGPMPSTPRLGETEDAFSIAVSFTGDMLLASLHGKRAAGNFLDYAAKQEPEYFLQHVRPIFEADDFTVVNLENVLTDRNLTPKEKATDPAYWFRAPAATTDILTSSGVEAVSLANNHTGDYNAAGYKDTVKAGPSTWRKTGTALPSSATAFGTKGRPGPSSSALRRRRRTPTSRWSSTTAAPRGCTPRKRGGCGLPAASLTTARIWCWEIIPMCSSPERSTRAKRSSTPWETSASAAAGGRRTGPSFTSSSSGWRTGSW